MSSLRNSNSPEDRREQRQDQIVEAAKELFSERGYHNTSISDIIANVGIARGTFYLYFTSKHSVFEAILDGALDGLRQRIERINIAKDARPPRDQLSDSIVRVLDFLLSDRPLSKLLLNHGLTPDADAAERVTAFYEGVIELIESSLTHGVVMGLIRECDTKLIAPALLGAVRGLVAHLLSSEQPLDVEAISHELLDFVLNGVIAPSLQKPVGHA